MRHTLQEHAETDFPPAVFQPDPAAWCDDAPGAPTPGDILGDAGKVLGATLAAVLAIDALVMLLR